MMFLMSNSTRNHWKPFVAIGGRFYPYFDPTIATFLYQRCLYFNIVRHNYDSLRVIRDKVEFLSLQSNVK